MVEKINHTGYKPQLDSLRAFAVLLVIISHWFDKSNFLNRFTHNGILGVTLFFVLSGYLITGILLKSKATITNAQSIKTAFKNFYVRRSLRIFPIYYLLLIILLVVNAAGIAESFSWHFFYLSNFYFWHQGAFSGHLSHFWSLAVEEQFYLFWPSVIIFIPLKKLQTTFVLGIFIAVAFRLLTASPEHVMSIFLMPASLDSFCLGALLAIGQSKKATWYAWLTRHFKLCFVVALGLNLAFVLLEYRYPVYSASYGFFGGYLLLISVLFTLIIMRCAQGITTPILSSMLNNKVVIYLGKISYGLYLYHNFVPYFYNIDLPVFLNGVSLYIVQLLRFVALVCIASCSWFFIEKPLLTLKKKFSYVEGPSMNVANA